YFDIIFSLFVSKNIILSPKKSYVGYFNVEFLNFYVNKFGIFIIKDYIEIFKNLTFPFNLKVLK
ncbi:hypothetical protein B0T20DRAFT_356200, partial [Sordaria brevicollis]